MGTTFWASGFGATFFTTRFFGAGAFFGFFTREVAGFRSGIGLLCDGHATKQFLAQTVWREHTMDGMEKDLLWALLEQFTERHAPDRSWVPRRAEVPLLFRLLSFNLHAEDVSDDDTKRGMLRWLIIALMLSHEEKSNTTRQPAYWFARRIDRYRSCLTVLHCVNSSNCTIGAPSPRRLPILEILTYPPCRFAI